MTNASFHRKIAFLLLLAILAAPWASAAGPRPAQVAAEPQDLLSRAWSWLTSIWSFEGCHIDPDGRCVPPPQPQIDEGCHIDPNGRCGS